MNEGNGEEPKMNVNVSLNLPQVDLAQAAVAAQKAACVAHLIVSNAWILYSDGESHQVAGRRSARLQQHVDSWGRAFRAWN